jgi:murein L,D-transpeptidase YafK
MLLFSHHIEPGRLEVFVRVFKIGRKVEVWGRNQGAAGFELLRTYPVAACSGGLGPKRREGDGQVPEGFYTINRFNPSSLYHLSLGLDYPNATDRQRGEAKPGGDIFIHGSNVTIGCVPITDALIEELYVLLVEARSAGQAEIPVHIFPFELNAETLRRYRQHRAYGFWQSLRPGYAYFEQHRNLSLPAVAVK